MVEALKERIAGEITMSADPGRSIRKWREEFDVTQHTLANVMGISNSVISDYESGRRKSPGVSTVKKMVDALIEIDKGRGSHVISRFVPDMRLDCILAMDEFPEGVDEDRFIAALSGRNLHNDRTTTKRIHGYTIVDSIKAILNLRSDDYLKIYGWSIERALIFTNVHYGRSPMVAIRAHPLTPAMVVYQRPDTTDQLAVKLAKLEGIPLVSTELSVEEIVNRMNALKDGK